MSYRADKQVIDTHTQTHGHTDRHTDAGDDNTRRPKLASGNRKTRYNVDAIGFRIQNFRIRAIRCFSNDNLNEMTITRASGEEATYAQDLVVLN